MTYVPHTVLIEHLIPRAALPANDQTNSDAIVAYLRRNPVSSLSEIARGTGYTKNRTSSLLSKYAYRGLIESTKSGGRFHGDTARNFYSVRVVQ